MDPVIEAEGLVLFQGDCREVLREFPDNTFDSAVTDPPYELGFMGKKWDATGVAYDVDFWREVMRVLKPGGHLLSFGGARTYHRVACAIEDAGFEIRESISWIYGQGFPKALDVSKAIDKQLGATREVVGVSKGAGKPSPDTHEGGILQPEYAETVSATPEAKQWDGWKSQLKPAHEPIVVAQKPFKGTIANNVLTHGVGALNIGGCRVGTSGGHVRLESEGERFVEGQPNTKGYPSKMSTGVPVAGMGRFPTDIVFSHSWDCGTIKRSEEEYDYVCVPGCPVAELDAQSGISQSRPVAGHKVERLVEGQPHLKGFAGGLPSNHNDKGGASRFFPVFKYNPKAANRDRPKVDGVSHPCVKPTELMRWLVRLVTPPNGRVLDPFNGTGSTGLAAKLEGFRYVGIEQDPKYVELARKKWN